MNAPKECAGRGETHRSSLIPSTSLSATAHQRILSQRGEPLFLADWMRVLMMHFEVDAEAMQRDVPYELDLHNGHAFVTLVAFTMENLRPRRGGKLGAWLFRPIATHDFLNVRTYVRHNNEPGIHFLAEWLSTGSRCDSAHAPSACRIGLGAFITNMIGQAVKYRGELRMLNRGVNLGIVPSQCSGRPRNENTPGRRRALHLCRAKAARWTNG